MSEEVGISIASCYVMLTADVGMRRVSADQKENLLFACADFKTGDETWIYGYDPETKARSRFGNSYCLNNDLH
jgi:hypothetical protein